MKPNKVFAVFGEPVEVLIAGEETSGKSTTLMQASPPGGGPPPHSHLHEDETFLVLEGHYEFLVHGAWQPMVPTEPIYMERGSIHTFRNVGSEMGKMLIFVTPSGIEKYLEEVSVLSMPGDMPKLLAVSERYGITFAGL